MSNMYFIINKYNKPELSAAEIVANKHGLYYYDGFKRVKEYLDEKKPGLYEELKEDMVKAYFCPELKEITKIIMDELEKIAENNKGVIYEGILDLTYASTLIPVNRSIYVYHSDKPNPKEYFGFYVIKKHSISEKDELAKKIEWYFSLA